MSRNSKNAQRILRRIVLRGLGVLVALLTLGLCIGCAIVLNLSEIRALLGS